MIYVHENCNADIILIVQRIISVENIICPILSKCRLRSLRSIRTNGQILGTVKIRGQTLWRWLLRGVQ